MKKSKATPASHSEIRTTLLVTRVSTSRQADNDEGSLKNQLQRLRSYMEYRNSSSEDWREVKHIELRAISGKDSVRSQEFQPLYEEVRMGRVNTVLGPDLDRVCRSVAEKLLTELVSMDQQSGRSFIKDKLNELGRRQLDLEHGLGELQHELDRLGQETVDTEQVRAALGQVKGLFGALRPYEQRELINLVLQRA